MKFATEEKLREIILYNLDNLLKVLKFNDSNGIKMFRICSYLIPFGSSPVNKLPWDLDYSAKFSEIGKFIKHNNLRVSMHPGQYTLLNSPNEDVTKRAIEDLDYHCKILDLMGLDKTHKVVLHIGGVYNDKEVAVKRFYENFDKLEKHIVDRIILENDDKYYNVDDVLEISNNVGVPVVYDAFHGINNPSATLKTFDDVMIEVKKTWKNQDGVPKIHYSQQAENARIGSHSNTINVNEFLDFYNQINNKNIDIMLEVKDKNISALKVLTTLKNLSLKDELNRHELEIMACSKSDYFLLKNIVKDNDKNYKSFYRILDSVKTDYCNELQAFDIVYKSLDKYLNEKEKKDIDGYIIRFKNEKLSNKALRRKLYYYVLKYNMKEFINSYYFMEE